MSAAFRWERIAAIRTKQCYSYRGVYVSPSWASYARSNYVSRLPSRRHDR
jgi:hypothetical protein